MLTQFIFFRKDIKRMLGKNKFRIIILWINRGFVGIFLYRLERSLYLLLGSKYQYFRLLVIPFFNLLQAYSNIDIHYKASIAGGLNILHPSMGIVISGRAAIGDNCTLIGGNVIGVDNRRDSKFILGANLHMGANSTIIGPLILGDNCTVGSLACVTKNFLESDLIIAGVPAKVLNAKEDKGK